jgi:hypothetical protein
MTLNDNKKTHLKGKQAKGIEALLTSDTIEKAAQKICVTRKTLYRWLKEDFFVKELNQAKRQLVQHGILRLQRATKDAVKTLLEICNDKKAPASSRVAASRVILKNTLKSIEFEDIENRLKSLEEDYSKLEK